MKKIDVKVYSGGFIECYSINCPLRKDCANHCSAGDFRNDWGIRPDIRSLTKNEYGEQFAQCFTTKETAIEGQCLMVKDIPIESDYDI